ncbi:MAG TPA: hypothetical protein GX742_02615 [Acholeplasmataceae bacterium]|nr:hypothetical protein [Acholeplasmataceae bacterium]
MNVENIKRKLLPILEPHKLSIYSIKKKHEFGEHIVEILLKGSNINTDLLEKVHLELYELLDDTDINPNYFLELSSVGAEYPLTSLEQIKEHVDAYLFIDANRFRGFGTLLEVQDEILIIRFNDKGQFRKIKIEYDTVRVIRTSVKI